MYKVLTYLSCNNEKFQKAHLTLDGLVRLSYVIKNKFIFKKLLIPDDDLRWNIGSLMSQGHHHLVQHWQHWLLDLIGLC